MSRLETQADCQNRAGTGGERPPQPVVGTTALQGETPLKCQAAFNARIFSIHENIF